MAVPGSTQALIAAFAFGILFNTASSALILFIKGHGSAIYRDGLRLALTLFLTSASLWSLVEFLSTLIDPTATSTCQVAVVFSSLFDQFGRAFVEQYLAWVVGKGGDKSTLTVLPQVLVFGRFGIGITFVALSRAAFNPTCVSVSSVRGIAFGAIALDAAIIGVVALNIFRGSPKNTAQPTAFQNNIVRLVVVGLAVWTGTSVTLQLGITSLALFFKTVLPGIGLILLVLLVTVFFQHLIVPREFPRRPDSPISREADQTRGLSSSDSAASFPPTRYEDLKATETVSVSAIGRETTRVIRRNEDGTFPAISRPMTANLDANGSAAQGQFFTPIPAAPGAVLAVPAVPTLPPDWKEKVERSKSLSNAKGKTGKFVISNPILRVDETTPNPLQKIPTIGLAEAAENERTRRERYAQRVSSLIASRPAPRPPSPPTASDVPILRKEVPATGLERSAPAKTTPNTGGLSVEGNASSTGSQLSPGSEAVRRRSPRYPEPAATALPFKVIKPGEPIRIPIPRPRQPTEDVPPPVPEPTKTPLQRRPTNGLPSNPRSQAMKVFDKEATKQRQQTVMFVNDIVYNDPAAINNIFHEAKALPPDSGNSIVNRPRPIPRKEEKDRQVFPSEIARKHGHRRSKSGSSLMNRQSIFETAAGSPTGLPSLPPLPKLTGVGSKSSADGTQNTICYEKGNSFSVAPTTAPLRSHLSQHQPPEMRVDEQPPVPAIDLVIKAQTPTKELFKPNVDESKRLSDSSKRTTARTLSVFGLVEDGSQQILADTGLEIENGFEQPQNIDCLGNSWVPGTSNRIRSGNTITFEETKRRSSQVLPPSRQQSILTDWSDSRTDDEDVVNNWVSVHSPIAPVARQNARSTYIRKDSESASAFEEIPIMIPVLLDDQEAENKFMLTDDNNSTLRASTPPRRHSGQFHHRVGDACPTFSTRKDKPHSRKMPPPTPLLLNGRYNKRAIIVQNAEPSPVESPEMAYQALQAQLKKLEQTDSNPVEIANDRTDLLENLELEMGQMESKWQEKHIDRDSVSTLRTSPTVDSRPASTAAPFSGFSSQRSSVASIIAERRALRRSRLQGAGEEGMSTHSSSRNSSQSSATTQASLWQSRLAQAQMEYMEQAPELLMKRNNLNFLSVSKAALGSPSPPETDGSDDEIHESFEDLRLVEANPSKPTNTLWTPPILAQDPPFSWLWNIQTITPSISDREYYLPGLSIRPAARKTGSSLQIESLRLWRPSPQSLKSQNTSSGLWAKESRRPQSVRASRPITIRPRRKSKRVTALPDILENPEPLPNKRGTLGIFQFPWGEKSEHPTIQYRPSLVYVAMPGTMTTGRPFIPPQPQFRQPEPSEYSSSFFDEYDEEEGDNFSDIGSDPEDDDFDETTLWEIASLLKTNQIPSRESLLPDSSASPSSVDASVLANFVAGMPSDEEYMREDFRDPRRLSEDVFLSDEPETTGVVARSLLWNSPVQQLQGPKLSLGLPQTSEVWHSPEIEPQAKPGTRSFTKNLDSLHSQSLWKPTIHDAVMTDGLLWTTSKKIVESAGSSIVPLEQRSLWIQPVVVSSPRVDGLFTVDVPRADFRTTVKAPITTSTSANTFRHDMSPLPRLTSNSLWGVETFKSAPQDGLWAMQSEASAYKTPEANISTFEVRVANISTVGLWTEPAEVVKSDASGLFDQSVDKVELRRTSKVPAAVEVSTKPRLTSAPLSALESTALWMPRPHFLEDNSSLVVPRLWQRQLASIMSIPVLFEIDPGRQQYRTTSAEPAAFDMTRRRRVLEDPVEQVQSARLWQNGEITRLELNWILMATRPPPSPSVSVTSSRASTSSSRSSCETSNTTPTETATITTNVSKEKVGGFFGGWFGKKAKKEKNASKLTQPQPTIVITEALPELLDDLVVRDSDASPRTRPTHIALRRQYRPAVAYNGDWDQALAEAIVASYPGTMMASRVLYPQNWDDQLQEAIVASHIAPKLVRQKLTPRDWSAALHQAVLESYPELRYSRGQSLSPQWKAALQEPIVGNDEDCFDVSVRHPVFFGTLQTSAETVHPALTGYRVAPAPQYFDVAVRHPVFFSSATVPAYGNVHPAMQGYRAVGNQPEKAASSTSSTLLWTAPSNATVPPSKGLWIPASSNNKNLDSLTKSSSNSDSFGLARLYRKDCKRPAPDADFVSGVRGLWKRGQGGNKHLRHPSLREKNWMHDSVNRRFTRIELRY
ncbi:hypothetical protein F5Y16DRAFT_281056 [Xylariaceae sp. FL0255]|nr:hypothetical protein F5Y16DRAFT_281056 [Xylariaceae sp. FL0255]